MRIVLAYDLSAESDRAAAVIAQARWPAATAVRVVTSPGTVGTPLSSFTGPSAARAHADRTREAVEAEHDRITLELGRAGVAVETAILPGRAGEAIVEEARRRDADLVVTGAGRLGVIEAAVLGSVSAEIVEHSPCSVLVVRTSVLQRVLLATDGSEPATAALAALATWPLFEAADIHVVGIADASGHAAGRARAEGGMGAAACVGAAVEELGRANRPVTSQIRQGDPGAEVGAAATEWGADLVVVGVNGEPRRRRLLPGSVARSVLGGVAASVLVVRAPRAEATDAAGED